MSVDGVFQVHGLFAIFHGMKKHLTSYFVWKGSGGTHLRSLAFIALLGLNTQPK